MDLLDRGWSARLTLVCAPAGFGKTSVVAQWLERSGRRSTDEVFIAWVSLDTADSEPSTYWRYVVSALQRVAPHVRVGELADPQAATGQPRVRGGCSSPC